MIDFAPLLVAFPLTGFLFLGLVGPRLKNETLIGIIASGVVGASFALAVGILFEMIALPVESRIRIVELFPWISAFTGSSHSLSLSVAYRIDQLSIVMTLIVTGVGFLIHVYSIGYMHGDKGYRRFFTYLNLFIFAMLNLVLAENFVLMFLGWEGVGLCSFLLIGFWYEKKFAEEAARKAFIVNRIGDFGFMIGMFLIFVTYGSLDFSAVFEQAKVVSVSPTIGFLVPFLLFIGATGKSAQIPLFVWLPDAMAGPTPVSALIHAATMVTAGVFMIARTSLLYAMSPAAMALVAVVGTITAIFAATIGLAQNDIKKVLAYSTISQLGYMFLAMGVAAFTAGIFHVMTHAFFKALLFLGSGAVIHGMHNEQDIQKMGGLKKYMPITYWTFLIGAIAISGIPPFSGFFSKDEILWSAFSKPGGSILLWLLGFLGAGITAFYMFRLVSLTFSGTPRFSSTHVHPHEAPSSMTIPLIVLAVLSVVGGLLGVPHVLGGSHLLEQWLAPVFEPAQRLVSEQGHASVTMEYILMALSATLASIAIWAAVRVYQRPGAFPDQAAASLFPRAYKTLLNKYYVDEVYDTIIVKPLLKISEKFFWKGVDVAVIDGTVDGTGKLVTVSSQFVRLIQNGIAQFYATMFVAGVLAILIYLFFV